MSFVPPLFAEEGCRLDADTGRLFSIGGFEINNSMIADAIASLVIIVFVQFAMRAPKLVPSGLQNFVEWLVEMMSDFLEGLTGRDTMQRGFWYFGSLFVFIFAGNFLALIPGVGTIGLRPWRGWDFEVNQPFLRGANANDNLTAAYTAIFFFMWFYWCIRQLGVGGVLYHIFGSQGQFPQPASQLASYPHFLPGRLDRSLFHFRRPPHRLHLPALRQHFRRRIPPRHHLPHVRQTSPSSLLDPVYFYELLVAFVQAFVFFVLTAVFTGIFTNPRTTHLHGGKGRPLTILAPTDSRSAEINNTQQLKEIIWIS